MVNTTVNTTVKNWILAARPKTLTAAVVPVLAGASLAHFHGVVFSFWLVVCCLVSALAIQIATNFINDLLDFKKGADTNGRIGPARVTQLGLIPEKQLIRGIVLMLLIALAAGVPLVIAGGWPILIIGLVSLVLAYCYTGGPVPLAYVGLGDLFVILFFGWIAVGGVYFICTGYYNLDAFILGSQIGLLSTVLIAINNFRDMQQDRLANKKTLAVRFGTDFMQIEISLLLLLPFVLQLYWLVLSPWWLVMVPFILFPLALLIIKNILETEPSEVYNKYLAQSAQLHAGFGLFLALSFYLA